MQGVTAIIYSTAVLLTLFYLHAPIRTVRTVRPKVEIIQLLLLLSHVTAVIAYVTATITAIILTVGAVTARTIGAGTAQTQVLLLFEKENEFLSRSTL